MNLLTYSTVKQNKKRIFETTIRVYVNKYISCGFEYSLICFIFHFMNFVLH